eukprot:s107_g16.t1
MSDSCAALAAELAEYGGVDASTILTTASDLADYLLARGDEPCGTLGEDRPRQLQECGLEDMGLGQVGQGLGWLALVGPPGDDTAGYTPFSGERRQRGRPTGERIRSLPVCVSEKAFFEDRRWLVEGFVLLKSYAGYPETT